MGGGLSPSLLTVVDSVDQREEGKLTMVTDQFNKVAINPGQVTLK